MATEQARKLAERFLNSPPGKEDWSILADMFDEVAEQMRDRAAFWIHKMSAFEDHYRQSRCDEIFALPLFSKDLLEMEWAPIGAGLDPDTDEPILAYGYWAGEVNGVSLEPSICVIYRGNGRTDYPGYEWRVADSDAYAEWFKPTHWMKLPDPPLSAPEAKEAAERRIRIDLEVEGERCRAVVYYDGIAQKRTRWGPDAIAAMKECSDYLPKSS